MAEKVKFQPQKFDINSINGGNRYGLEGIQPEAVNAPIEAAAYAQALATNQPNIENAGLVGTPSVSIEEVDGLPRLKFENLKGEKGQDGKDHSSEILTLNNEVTALKNEQKQQNILIRNNTLAVENVYAILENTVTDKVKMTSQYTTRQTANGNQDIIDGSLTPVNLIAGDTVKTTNLCPFPYFDGMSKTYNGVTWTVNSDGSVTANGTATGGNSEYCFIFNSQKITYEPNEYYWYRACPAGGSGSIDTYWVYLSMHDETGAWKNDAGNEFGNGSYWIKNTAYFIRFVAIIKEGYTANNLVFKPIYGYGREVKEYVPYFSGLKHAYFKGIKSTGKNLFNEEYVKGAYNALNGNFSEDSAYVASKEKIKVIGGQSYYIYYEAKTTEYVVYVIYYDKNGKYISYIYNPTAPFVVPSNCAYINIDIYNGGTALTIDDVGKCMVTMSSVAKSDYVPYGEHLFELPETLELKKWDSLNPQTGELIRQTGTATSATGFTEEEIASYNKAIVSADGLSLAYKLATPTVTKLDNIPKSYKAYNGGSETVVQGETDNSEYGAMPEITQEYYTQKGVK